MMRGPFTLRPIVRSVIAILTILGAATVVCLGADGSPRNLALSALGAKARTWEPGVTVVPEHEPSKVNDGSVHTYWAVRASDLPADIGVEWPKPIWCSC